MQYLPARGLVFWKPQLPNPRVGSVIDLLTVLKTQYSAALSCVNIITDSSHPNHRMTSGLFQTALVARNNYKMMQVLI